LATATNLQSRSGENERRATGDRKHRVGNEKVTSFITGKKSRTVWKRQNGKLVDTVCNRVVLDNARRPSGSEARDM
jgi:hypothetical protein